jgi:predicted DNA-binding transcriptional regulator AlpA
MSLITVQVDESLNPLLISAAELARLLQVSTRTVWRLVSADQVPKPVRFAGTVRWGLEKVKKWIAEGCPLPEERENDRGRK